MEHPDHVKLLRNGIPQQGGVWADFGSGSGAFTLALRDLVGADAELYSIDQDGRRLKEQARAFAQMFPRTNIHFIHANLSHALALPPLDGAIMANVLHFFRNQKEILEHVRGFLKPGGTLLVVEYNDDRGNQWVPHPMRFETFRSLAERAGFKDVRLLATYPSRFLHEIYAAGMVNGKASA